MQDKKIHQEIFNFLLPYFKFSLPKGNFLVLGEQVDFLKTIEDPDFDFYSSKSLNLPDQSIEIALWLFPPELNGHFARIKQILKPGGYFLALFPQNQDRLFDLREKFIKAFLDHNLMSLSFTRKGNDFLLICGRKS